ncbi:MAG: hypothetical protein QW728_06950, partial [Thermoplasmata archaeon]
MSIINTTTLDITGNKLAIITEAVPGNSIIMNSRFIVSSISLQAGALNVSDTLITATLGDFRDSSTAHLQNVTVPAVVVDNAATVWIWWKLTCQVIDAVESPVYVKSLRTGAKVVITPKYNFGTQLQIITTVSVSPDGIAALYLPAYRIDSRGTEFTGNYEVRAEYSRGIRNHTTSIYTVSMDSNKMIIMSFDKVLVPPSNITLTAYYFNLSEQYYIKDGATEARFSGNNTGFVMYFMSPMVPSSLRSSVSVRGYIENTDYEFRLSAVIEADDHNLTAAFIPREMYLFETTEPSRNHSIVVTFDNTTKVDSNPPKKLWETSTSFYINLTTSAEIPLNNTIGICGRVKLDVNLPVNLNNTTVEFDITSIADDTLPPAYIVGDGPDPSTRYSNITGRYLQILKAEPAWDVHDSKIRVSTSMRFTIDNSSVNVSKAVELPLSFTPEIPTAINLILDPPAPDYNINTGDKLIITGMVRYNTLTPCDGVTVSVSFPKNPTITGSTTTSASGTFVLEVKGVPAGTHDFTITAQIPGTPFTTSRNARVVVSEEGTNVLLIVVIVLAALFLIVGAAAIGIYVYFKGQAEKYVECGECRAFIPENSKRCPNCGIEFEEEIAKCSNCEAWVPANSITCPECGAAFKQVSTSQAPKEDSFTGEMGGAAPPSPPPPPPPPPPKKK